MADRLVLSADLFQYWAIDFVRNELLVVTADGQRHTEALSTPSWPNNQVAQSVFDWERWWIFSTTTRGDMLISEAYSPITTGPRRPTVYLDQNHWSTVAWAMVDPSKVTRKDELAAALRIIELATDAGIVLPLSSSHYIETGPLYGERRYHLGLAMAKLSGGWQLRHPTAVWDNEVAVILARYAGAPLPTFSELPVITTEPQAFLANDVRAYEIDNDWELLQLVLSEPSITLSCLIDITPEPKIISPAWAQRNQEITDYFAGKGISNKERRLQAAGFFWTDNIQVVARAATRVGIDASPFLQDPRALVQQLDSMPFLSNLSALFRLRHLDRNTRWKENDLIDMMALSCAAGYCDYVAAERHTGTQLRQIMSARGTPPNTFLTLAELVDALDRDGVKTAVESASSADGM
ncbi:hypothetical protein OHA21_48550 [Actinoplanes sp. NBC_00393]|uniref:hypothetical protein n=1 Tax=Actinoplanes sp. NBC_00393 TaxID=2975953 RepID=UPI002E23A2C0